MSAPLPGPIRSRDNPLVKELRQLAQDGTAYRKLGRLWLEGDHLCRALLAHGLAPAVAVLAESLPLPDAAPWVAAAGRTVVLADALFGHVSGLESPARLACVVALPAPPALEPGAATVVLDRLQDAGNVGSILRSAAAFGFRQVLALKGTAALWSPKVVRAGMGAHFGLRLLEGLDGSAVDALTVPLLATSSHQGVLLHDGTLPWPCAWAFGHEGQGLAPELARRADRAVRIAQPGGEESLNVAAAAAICLHASVPDAAGYNRGLSR